jgi:hypothetical protein
VPISRNVSQISPPIRIVVVAAIGLMAAWMLFLRPKADETAPPAPAASTATAPGVKGLTNAVDKAKAAAATQEASDAKVQAATGGSTDSQTAQAAPKAGAAETTTQSALQTGRVLTLAPLEDTSLKSLPKRMRNAFERRQVVVIGVINGRDKPWAPMPADDEQVMHTLRHVNRYHGNVAVVSTKLGGLSRLNPVIGDLDVSQTPSVVVVDRNRKATVVAGYVDKVSINQAIADARRNSIAFRVKGAYLTSLNDTCAHYSMRRNRFELPSRAKDVKPALGRFARLVGTYERRFAALKPAPRWKGLQAQVLQVVRNDQKAIAGLRAAVKSNSVARVNQVIAEYDATAAIALDKRLDKVGVTSCVGNRHS